jgi:hypothetical protein
MFFMLLACCEDACEWLAYEEGWTYITRSGFSRIMLIQS